MRLAYYYRKEAAVGEWHRRYLVLLREAEGPENIGAFIARVEAKHGEPKWLAWRGEIEFGLFPSLKAAVVAAMMQAGP